MRRVTKDWIILDDKGARGIAGSSVTGSKDGDKHIKFLPAVKIYLDAEDHDNLNRFGDGKSGL